MQQFSSPSPYSLSPGDFEDQSPDLASNLNHHQLVATDEQQTLHLLPGTWSEFLELDPPSSGYCDYVDGLVVYCPPMANRQHNRVADSAKTIFECKDSNLYIYLCPSLQVITGNKLVWTVDDEQDSDSRGSASSSTERPPQISGLRHPDFVITSTRRNSTGSSSTATDVKIEWRIPYPTKLLGVVEITSDSTRDVDLYTKWTTYARSKVPLYVILDRGTKTYPECVIVGSLTRFSRGLEKKAHGDPNPSKRRTPVPDEEPIYYRKIYSAEDKVDCPFFEKLDMTARELLDVNRMQKLAKQLYHDRANQRERAEKAEKEKEKEKKEKEKEKKEKEEQRKRAERAEKEKEKEKKEKEKEKKEKEEQRKRAERAEESVRKLEEEIRSSRDEKRQNPKARAGTQPKKKAVASASGSSPTKPPHRKKRREGNKD